MFQGSCLCGGVRFEVDRAAGPFELCHCSRCRKASGSAFVAGLGVLRRDFRLLAGGDLIRTYEAPVRERPPGYRSFFCGRCGSPLPDANGRSDWFEIPAGLLDDDPGARPDRHIFVEHAVGWLEPAGDLPRLERAALYELRRRSGPPA